MTIERNTKGNLAKRAFAAIERALRGSFLPVFFDEAKTLRGNSVVQETTLEVKKEFESFLRLAVETTVSAEEEEMGMTLETKKIFKKMFMAAPQPEWQVLCSDTVISEIVSILKPEMVKSGITWVMPDDADALLFTTLIFFRMKQIDKTNQSQIIFIELLYYFVTDFFEPKDAAVSFGFPDDAIGEYLTSLLVKDGTVVFEGKRIDRFENIGILKAKLWADFQKAGKMSFDDWNNNIDKGFVSASKYAIRRFDNTYTGYKTFQANDIVSMDHVMLVIQHVQGLKNFEIHFKDYLKPENIEFLTTEFNSLLLNAGIKPARVSDFTAISDAICIAFNSNLMGIGDIKPINETTRTGVSDALKNETTVIAETLKLLIELMSEKDVKFFNIINQVTASTFNELNLRIFTLNTLQHYKKAEEPILPKEETMTTTTTITTNATDASGAEQQAAPVAVNVNIPGAPAPAAPVAAPVAAAAPVAEAPPATLSLEDRIKAKMAKLAEEREKDKAELKGALDKMSADIAAHREESSKEIKDIKERISKIEADTNSAANAIIDRIKESAKDPVIYYSSSSGLSTTETVVVTAVAGVAVAAIGYTAYSLYNRE